MTGRQEKIIFALLVIMGMLAGWFILRVLYTPPAPEHFCWGSYDYCASHK